MTQFADLDLHAFGDTLQLAGVVYTGNDQTVICLFPDEHIEGTITVVDPNLEEWQRLLNQVDTLEVQATVRMPNGSLAKAFIRKSQRQISQDVSWNVFRRDEYKCRYCGADGVPLTVDHLVLWEDGGPSTAENLVAACRKCNKIRGNTPYPLWMEHPRYQASSKNLTEEVRQRNLALVRTLDLIPRQHVRSR